MKMTNDVRLKPLKNLIKEIHREIKRHHNGLRHKNYSCILGFLTDHDINHPLMIFYVFTLLTSSIMRSTGVEWFLAIRADHLHLFNIKYLKHEIIFLWPSKLIYEIYFLVSAFIFLPLTAQNFIYHFYVVQKMFMA